MAQVELRKWKVALQNRTCAAGNLRVAATFPRPFDLDVTFAWFG